MCGCGAGSSSKKTLFSPAPIVRRAMPFGLSELARVAVALTAIACTIWFGGIASVTVTLEPCATWIAGLQPAVEREAPAVAVTGFACPETLKLYCEPWRPASLLHLQTLSVEASLLFV